MILSQKKKIFFLGEKFLDLENFLKKFSEIFFFNFFLNFLFWEPNQT